MGSIKDELRARLEKLGISAEEFDAKIAERKQARESPERLEAEQRAATAHLETAPRYDRADVLTLSEAKEILRSVPALPDNPKVEGVFDPETMLLPSVQRIRGPVTLDELHLPAEGSNLFVEGSLTVEGIIAQDFRAGGLLVLGDLKARHIVTCAAIACTGDLTVSDALFGNCTNYGTNVWGRARAKVLVSAKEHIFSFWGGHDIEMMIDVYGDTPNLEGHHYTEETMHEVLHPDFGDGFDERQVLALLRRLDTVLC